nr:hypothetical protein [Prevotella sp.]
MKSQNETNKKEICSRVSARNSSSSWWTTSSASPATADGIHTLTLTPNDPAIVFEKIVSDGRGGKGRVKVI